MARKIVSKRGMSVAEGTVHWVMIIFTCGLWYPVYRARKHQAGRTTTTIVE
jgi:hypothetical protein